MIITLGRNIPNGKTTTVIESVKKDIYLRTYKQKNGMSDFSKVVESILLDDERIKHIVEYYNRLK